MTNDPISTTEDEYITETTQTISLKTGIKKIPKSLKQPSLVSISQTNSVTEDITDVSKDTKSSGTIYILFYAIVQHQLPLMHFCR